MLQNMGPQSAVLFDKSALHLLATQQQATQATNCSAQPLSPIDPLVQLQLLQTNALLLSQTMDEKPHRRLDRSVSEPYGSQESVLKAQLNQSSKNILNPNRYKTEMCRPFVENGGCKYGDKCQFAHGVKDQRSVPRHPKYKTEYCKTFHTTGICPYGPRCHYIHNEDENKLGEISHMKRQHAAVQAAQEMAKQAAQLQLQHQMLQNQLQSLVSQVNHQLVSQLAVPSTVTSVTQPLSIQRPRLTHSISVHPTMRGYSFGSTADTPPESLSTSPIRSPTYTQSEDSVSDSLSDTVSGGLLTPPMSGDLNSSFTFPGGDMSPLQMSPQRQVVPSSQETICSITNLSASLEALALGQSAHNYTPSTGENPTHYDLAKTNSAGERYRLPVFNQIVGC